MKPSENDPNKKQPKYIIIAKPEDTSIASGKTLEDQLKDMRCTVADLHNKIA